MNVLDIIGMACDIGSAIWGVIGWGLHIVSGVMWDSYINRAKKHLNKWHDI